MILMCMMMITSTFERPRLCQVLKIEEKSSEVQNAKRVKNYVKD